MCGSSSGGCTWFLLECGLLHAWEIGGFRVFENFVVSWIGVYGLWCVFLFLQDHSYFAWFSDSFLWYLMVIFLHCWLWRNDLSLLIVSWSKCLGSTGSSLVLLRILGLCVVNLRLFKCLLCGMLQVSECWRLLNFHRDMFCFEIMRGLSIVRQDLGAQSASKKSDFSVFAGEMKLCPSSSLVCCLWHSNKFYLINCFKKFWCSWT